jgi:phospholipid/cholesterol/gamma-HCH transport system permease protein
LGAYVAGTAGGFISSEAFLSGLQDDFIPYQLAYAFIKTFFFALILATIPSYHGYYMKGGSLEVGEASTTSFVWTSVLLVVANYVLTQILLS